MKIKFIKLDEYVRSDEWDYDVWRQTMQDVTDWEEVTPEEYTTYTNALAHLKRYPAYKSMAWYEDFSKRVFGKSSSSLKELIEPLSNIHILVIPDGKELEEIKFNLKTLGDALTEYYQGEAEKERRAKEEKKKKAEARKIENKRKQLEKLSKELEKLSAEIN